MRQWFRINTMVASLCVNCTARKTYLLGIKRASLCRAINTFGTLAASRSRTTLGVARSWGLSWDYCAASMGAGAASIRQLTSKAMHALGPLQSTISL
jgi:hypothetical protein